MTVSCQHFADPPCTSLENKNRVCLTKEELSKKGLGVLRAFMKGGDPWSDDEDDAGGLFTSSFE